MDQLEAGLKNDTYRKFVQQHLASPVSLYALSQVAGYYLNPEEIEPLFNNLSPQIRHSKAGRNGVSLDKNKESWLKAIQADKLSWTQVSDLKYWNNDIAKKLDIRSIPQNILLDPSGKIIARNLRGDELSEILDEIFE